VFSWCEKGDCSVRADGIPFALSAQRSLVATETVNKKVQSSLGRYQWRRVSSYQVIGVFTTVVFLEIFVKCH